MSEPTRIRAPELPDNLDWFNTDEPLTLASQRGKVVLLDFWTYCCINCMHVLPDLLYLENKYPDSLTVIGMHSPKFENEHVGEQVQKAINRHHIRHPVANDPRFQMWRAYGIKAWPSIIFIDPEGYVVGILRGEGRRQQLDELIRKHLDAAEEKGILATSPMPSAVQPEPDTMLQFPGKVLATRNNLYIADSGRNRILETYHDGKVRRIFGSGTPGMLDGKETAAMFSNPQGMTLVGDFLYIADTDNHAIRRIHLKSGDVMTLAGDGKQGRYVADSFREPLDAQLNSPWDLTYYESTLYIAMAGQHQIWRMNLNHLAIERFAGSGREDIVDGPVESACFAQPSGITALENTLYIADSETSAIRVLHIDQGTVSTLVGKGLFDFGDRDGVGREARLQHPVGITVDPERNALWVADTFNSKIKRIDLQTNEVSKFKFGVPLDEPGGMSLFRDKLFIANTNAHQIVMLDLSTRMAEVVNVRESD
ncbi:thiol-disulfide isomerase/thioredoxin [Thiogranum longum]|uniref:Thiol-disulfide isomerase/thioredoxin n=1 Tax=Thiogranum longum TaxID=1537524 RepID=A0A4R1HC81_9GAMM|nr:thioredoxin-like domain-containing protein [Thiogranum longum]TCK18153.1 thiol-disulfide isomerase/thioredoxin [Thiogranum longum]